MILDECNLMDKFVESILINSPKMGVTILPLAIPIIRLIRWIITTYVHKKAIQFVVSKVWDWYSTSVKLSCEINFFLFSWKYDIDETGNRLTITQRIKITKTYYKNGDSATGSYRALRWDYGLYNRLAAQAIGKIGKKFVETEVIAKIERHVHHRFARSAENITIVSESVAEDSNVSIIRLSQEIGLSYCTLWHILYLDLHLHLYKVQLTQQLKPTYHS